MLLQLLSATATQPNTGAAAAAVGNDSLVVLNGRGKIQIIAAWGRNQVAGFAQIITPSMHDSTRGVRSGVPVGSNLAVLPWCSQVDVQPQETLDIQIAGSNVAGDVEQVCLLMRYDDVPGLNQRLIDESELDRRIEKRVTIEMSNVSTAGPSYGTATVITTPADLLKANRDYAVLGATVRTACMAVYLVGPDTANVRVGVPGDVLKPEICGQWFALMSRFTGKPCIPVISSGNKASTFAHAIADENGGTFLTTWHLALLK